MTTINNYIRIGNTVIDADYAAKHAGKTLIIFDTDMYSYGKEQEEKYPSSKITDYVQSCRNWEVKHNKQAIPPDADCLYIPASCDWNYSCTATAQLNATESYHMSRGDSDYVLLQTDYISSYAGHSRGGFINITLPGIVQ